MKNNKTAHEEYALAVYMLKNRIHNPMDLIKYWAFSGPCLESHPSIEDYNAPQR